MVFNVAPDADHPAITNEGMVYEGQRHSVTCTLAGKPYGQLFGLDIAFADPILGEPDIAVASDVLGFVGIDPTARFDRRSYAASSTSRKRSDPPASFIGNRPSRKQMTMDELLRAWHERRHEQSSRGGSRDRSIDHDDCGLQHAE
jgi:hypothetical protein